MAWKDNLFLAPVIIRDPDARALITLMLLQMNYMLLTLAFYFLFCAIIVLCYESIQSPFIFFYGH